MNYADLGRHLEAEMVVLDVVRGGGLGERVASIFELWIAPPWPVGFTVNLANSDGTTMGVAVFRMTGRNRYFRGKVLMLYELSQFLPEGSETDYVPVRLSAFAAQLS